MSSDGGVFCGTTTLIKAVLDDLVATGVRVTNYCPAVERYRRRVTDQFAAVAVQHAAAVADVLLTAARPHSGADAAACRPSTNRGTNWRDAAVALPQYEGFIPAGVAGKKPICGGGQLLRPRLPDRSGHPQRRR